MTTRLSLVGSKAASWSLAALLVCACASQTDLLKSDLVRAKHRWQAATCMEELPEMKVQPVEGKMGCGMLPSVVGCHTAGLALIDILQSAAERAWTVLHEYGHEISQQQGHLPGSSQGVMARDLSSAVRWITRADITYVCAYQTCHCRKPETK